MHTMAMVSASLVVCNCVPGRALFPKPLLSPVLTLRKLSKHKSTRITRTTSTLSRLHTALTLKRGFCPPIP